MHIIIAITKKHGVSTNYKLYCHETKKEFINALVHFRLIIHVYYCTLSPKLTDCM